MKGWWKMSENYLNNSIEEKLYRIVTETLKEDVTELKRNEDSSDGNVYDIKCKKNKYIAKVYNDKTHASSMSMLHKKLRKQGINVPSIIYDNLDAENEEYIIIYSFINGKQITDVLQDGKVRNRNNIINFKRNKKNA